MHEKFIDTVLGIVKGVETRLLARMEAIEKREPIHGRDGLPGVPGSNGKDGKDADPALILELKAEIADLRQKLVNAEPQFDLRLEFDAFKAEQAKSLAEAIATLPTPQHGKDGTSVTVDDVAPFITAEVQKAVAAQPKPQNGKDGKDIDPAVVEDMVADWVTRAVAALPKVKDGQDGTGLVGAVIDRDGALVLTFSNGTTQTLGVIVGKDGEKGEPGANGFGFDDFEVEHDGERGFIFKFVQGDRVKSFGPFVIPTVIDKGVYRPGEEYEKGQGVSWDGSFWIAQEATTAKPGQSKAWRLAVKKGRDGNIGPEGKQGPPGPKGDKGDRGPDRF